MFRRRRQPLLDEESYARWLCAGRPQPVTWFLELDADEQEALAQLGDAYAQETAVAIGYAVRDPEAAHAGMAPGDDVEAEERLAVRRAVAAAQGIISQMGASVSRESPEEEAPTMAGLFGEKR